MRSPWTFCDPSELHCDSLVIAYRASHTGFYGEDLKTADCSRISDCFRVEALAAYEWIIGVPTYFVSHFDWIVASHAPVGIRRRRVLAFSCQGCGLHFFPAKDGVSKAAGLSLR
jgi:hypothetical protein